MGFTSGRSSSTLFPAHWRCWGHTWPCPAPMVLFTLQNLEISWEETFLLSSLTRLGEILHYLHSKGPLSLGSPLLKPYIA